MRLTSAALTRTVAQLEVQKTPGTLTKNTTITVSTEMKLTGT